MTVSKYDKYKFIRSWKGDMRTAVGLIYPQLSDVNIETTLNEMIDERIINPKCTIHNNYEGRSFQIDLLNVINWMTDQKPIIGGFGCFYKNQDIEKNPAANMLAKFLSDRSMIKGKLKDLLNAGEDPGSAICEVLDRGQLIKKQAANSYYGASGAPTSIFFNLYTAQSTTATGQSLISTTETAFENFLCNNCKFFDLNECMNYIVKVIEKEDQIPDNFIGEIKPKQVLIKLKDTFLSWKDSYELPIMRLLNSLDSNKLKRIYYNNNLYEFCDIPKIHDLLARIFVKCDEFMNPNKPPKEIVAELDDLWEYMLDFVVYNNFVFERINRLKYHTRQTVTTIDTDSNMICLLEWVEYCKTEIWEKDSRLQDRDQDKLLYIAISTMAFIVTKVITEILYKYTTETNFLERFKPKINMKNEYLFSIQVLADVKKRYITNVLIREGALLNPQVPDIKGFDFIKSSTSIETRDFFKELINKYILYSDDIDLGMLLKEIIMLESSVIESLRRGEKTYLTPASTRDLAAYADCIRLPQVLGVLAWNAAYPNNVIRFGDKVDLVKVNLETLDQAEPLKDSHPDIYEGLFNDIYNCMPDNVFPEEDASRIRKKGVKVIAIPRSIDKVPDWILPYIKTDEVANKIINKFFPVLNSLGMKIYEKSVKSQKKYYYTNVF